MPAYIDNRPFLAAPVSIIRIGFGGTTTPFYARCPLLVGDLCTGDSKWFDVNNVLRSFRRNTAALVLWRPHSELSCGYLDHSRTTNTVAEFFDLHGRSCDRVNCGRGFEPRGRIKRQTVEQPRRDRSRTKDCTNSICTSPQSCVCKRFTDRRCFGTAIRNTGLGNSLGRNHSTRC